MELLLFWGIPVIAALIGFQRMFYHAFQVFVCFAFAAYLGVWSEGLFSVLFGFVPAQLRPAFAIPAGAILIGVVLFLAFHSLNLQKKVFTFPPLIERAGGALLGLLSGMILVRFLGLAVCLSPFKTDLPLGMETASFQARSVSGIMAVTKGINLVTLQSGRNTSCRERLDALLSSADEAAGERRVRNGGTPAIPDTTVSEQANRPGTLRNIVEQKELREEEVNR